MERCELVSDAATTPLGRIPAMVTVPALLPLKIDTTAASSGACAAVVTLHAAVAPVKFAVMVSALTFRALTAVMVIVSVPLLVAVATEPTAWMAVAMSVSVCACDVFHATLIALPSIVPVNVPAVEVPVNTSVETCAVAGL